MSDEPTCCAGSDGNHSDYCPRHAAVAESELAPVSLLAAIRESAQGRAEYLRGKAERFNEGPADYKQLMAREKTMIDLAEVMAGAIRRLAANKKLCRATDGDGGAQPE